MCLGIWGRHTHFHALRAPFSSYEHGVLAKQYVRKYRPSQTRSFIRQLTFLEQSLCGDRQICPTEPNLTSLNLCAIRDKWFGLLSGICVTRWYCQSKFSWMVSSALAAVVVGTLWSWHKMPWWLLSSIKEGIGTANWSLRNVLPPRSWSPGLLQSFQIIYPCPFHSSFLTHLFGFGETSCCSASLVITSWSVGLMEMSAPDGTVSSSRWGFSTPSRLWSASLHLPALRTVWEGPVGAGYHLALLLHLAASWHSSKCHWSPEFLWLSIRKSVTNKCTDYLMLFENVIHWLGEKMKKLDYTSDLQEWGSSSKDQFNESCLRTIGIHLWCSSYLWAAKSPSSW